MTTNVSLVKEVDDYPDFFAGLVAFEPKAVATIALSTGCLIALVPPTVAIIRQAFFSIAFF